MPHPDYLLRLLTADQLRDWEIYHGLEPWGYVENDIQTAYTRKIMFDAAGCKKQDKTPFTIDEFSVETMRAKAMHPKKKQSPEEVINIFKSLKTRGKPEARTAPPKRIKNV